MKPDPEAPLAQTVAALGKEVRDLRASARMRAVIEQAKGVLVERHGITLDEAFERLRSMSQEHNVRVVEVAATVVGVAIPEAEDAELGDRLLEEQLPVSPATSSTWRTLRQQPDVRAGVVTAIMDAVASSTDTGHEAAELVLDLLEPHDVAAVTIYRTSPDGSLRLVGQVNVPSDLASSWRSVPPSTDIPFVRSVLDEVALFWGDRDERLREYPQLSQAASVAFEATATIPVADQGVVVGVVGLVWRTRQTFDDARRETITRAVQRVAPLLMRNLRASDPELEWLNALMGLHLDPWLLLDVVVDSQGVPSGLVVQDVEPGVAGGQAWLGRRVLEIWPFMAQDGTREALMGLARTGGAWSTTITQQSPAPWGSPGSIVRAVRLGQRIALLWRALPA
ncbi:MAG: ANTAR domain-containing protein [Micrococcales bacterium]|nr:ANTAR domain-containing protein [Micrococcales bacterium]